MKIILKILHKYNNINNIRIKYIYTYYYYIIINTVHYSSVLVVYYILIFIQ